MIFMIWSYGYAKNILDSQQTDQDITSGGGNSALVSDTILVPIPIRPRL